MSGRKRESVKTSSRLPEEVSTNTANETEKRLLKSGKDSILR